MHARIARRAIRVIVLQRRTISSIVTLGVLKAAAQRTRPLAPGDKLGKYELIRQIAIGGMAELYLARTIGIEGFEKLVVLKRILPQYARHAAFVEMFLHEARLAATLHHANIAQVYDIGGDDGDYFFAMEYVHGEDLDRISTVADEQGVALAMDCALTVVSGLCAGLHYAHERTGADGKPMGIVHRDVSPSNVVVSYDGAVKLVDFGVAWAASRPGVTDGGLKGKIAYMSPEQCRGKAQIDRRSDLYSVGTLLYELTTGKPPFAGDSEYQVLHQIVNDDVPPPSTIVPGYPAQLERIVLRALARDPDQRYATALALQSDLEDFAHESQLRISPLVLARLMSTLFPLRVEEWDQARTQGGFFLEQHVLRTLDASGKMAERGEGTGETTDDEHTASERTMPERVPGEGVTLAAGTMPEHPANEGTMPEGTSPERTSPQSASPEGTSPEGTSPEITASGLGAAPLTFTSLDVGFPDRMLLPYERTGAGGEPVAPPPSIDVPAPPEPLKPTPYPVVTELMSATPGALVTAVGKYGGVPTTPAGQRSDPTERVRFRPRRAASPTEFVRTPRRTSLLLGVVVVAAVAIAAFLVLRPSSSKGRSPATAEPYQQLPVVSAPVAEPSAAVSPPSAGTPAGDDLSGDGPDVTKAPVAAKKTSPKKLAGKPKPKPVPKSDPKRDRRPAPKKAAKETSWNADSPFMPVRTDK
jgi:serine/threonine protein kinase